MSQILLQEGARGRDTSEMQLRAPLVLLISLMLIGQFHGFVAPYAPDAGTGQPLAPPGIFHPLGTDIVGRDLLSETLHALGASVQAVSVGLFFALVAGHLAGMAAAHLFGRLGAGFRIGANVLGSLPPLLLAILFSALLLPGSAAIAAGLAVAPHAFLRGYDRARAVLAAPYSDFARASGVSDMALFLRDVRHELRDIVPVIVLALAAIATIYSTMSFFGFGAKPPSRDLGLMIASARADLPEAWWTAAVPAAMLILFIMTARLSAGGARR